MRPCELLKLVSNIQTDTDNPNVKYPKGDLKGCGKQQPRWEFCFIILCHFAVDLCLDKWIYGYYTVLTSQNA